MTTGAPPKTMFTVHETACLDLGHEPDILFQRVPERMVVRFWHGPNPEAVLELPDAGRRTDLGHREIHPDIWQIVERWVARIHAYERQARRGV